MEKKGFIAVFAQPLDKTAVTEFVTSWLERFEKVEQVVPTEQSTLEVKSGADIMWEPHMQYRVSNGPQFAWVYVSLDHRTVETTGFADAEISFCLEVLLELPEVIEVVEEKNHRRLDELEREGIV